MNVYFLKLFASIFADEVGSNLRLIFNLFRFLCYIDMNWKMVFIVIFRKVYILELVVL